MFKKLNMLILIISLIVINGCSNSETSKNEGTDYGLIQKQCLDLNGKWIDSAKECENISEKDCTELKGVFSECASACRNNPKADVCTMQCVQVCKISN